MTIYRPISESAAILTFPIREVGCDVRVLTTRHGGLLGPEFLVAYGPTPSRYFRCGKPSLSQLKRGVSPDELFLLEIENPDASDAEIWGE